MVTEFKIFSSSLLKGWYSICQLLANRQVVVLIGWVLYVPEQVRPSWAWERTWPRPSGVWRRLTPLWLSRLVANCSSASSASHRWSTLWVERGPSPILLTVTPRLLLYAPSPLFKVILHVFNTWELLELSSIPSWFKMSFSEILSVLFVPQTGSLSMQESDGRERRALS